MKNQKYAWELRQVDAWGNREDGYTWNESFHIKNVKISSGRERNCLMQNIRKGYRRQYKVVYDGSVYELQLRKTDEPIFALLPIDD